MFGKWEQNYVQRWSNWSRLMEILGIWIWIEELIYAFIEHQYVRLVELQVTLPDTLWSRQWDLYCPLSPIGAMEGLALAAVVRLGGSQLTCRRSQHPFGQRSCCWGRAVEILQFALWELARPATPAPYRGRAYAAVKVLLTWANGTALRLLN